MNKLSVILPVSHRNVQWLDRAIESTRGFADELVVVTDEKALFESVLQFNPLISELLMVRSTGVTKAINAGIAAATGNWISILCSDDYYDQQANLLKLSMQGSRWNKIIGGQTKMEGTMSGIWPQDGKLDNLEQLNNIQGSALFCKSLWLEFGGFKDVRYNDWDFWKRVYLLYQTGYIFVPYVTYHYTAWSGTISARYGYNSNLGHEWGDGPTDK